MKKLLIIAAVLLILLPVPASASGLISGKNVVYRGTVTGLRMSSVNGTALIDGANASITALADGNHEIQIYDSAGRMLRGFLKAAGSSETLSNLFADPMSSNQVALWDIMDGGTLVFSTDHYNWDSLNAGDSAKKIVTVVAGALYKMTTDVMNGIATGVQLANGFTKGSNGAAVVNGATYTTTGSFVTNAAYLLSPTETSIRSGIQVISGPGGADTIQIKNHSLDKVTAPSTSGATIVSTKGGSTYNFAYRNAAFTYNAGSYYVIVAKVR